MSLVNNAWKKNLETYGPYFSSMLVSASDWLKLIFEKVCGFAYIKITLSTNLDMHKRFQGSFCCDLPLQDLNLVSASGGMVTGWNSHQPEIFVFKSSSQTQNCRAHKKGQLCHQDQPSTCLCSKVRDRVMTAFQLAPKWLKGANGGFGAFGSYQQYLTHRQLDWSTLVFIKSPFLGYPTCLLFGHVVWWSTSLWTARTTRRRRPGRYLTFC